MNKSTKVKLMHDKIQNPKSFGFEHAQKILKMKNNGGWKLADSKFIIDKDGNIKPNTVKKDSKGEQ